MTMMRRVIDASDIGRYEDRLVDALAEAIGSGRALRMDPFAVEPSTFPDEVAAENERRCIEANIRKHFDRGVALGLFEGRCAIAWHPGSGALQVSAIQPRPEQNYQPVEEALVLLGALLTDIWDPNESLLTADLFLDLVSGDYGAPADLYAAERLTSLLGGMMSEIHDLVLCFALLHHLAPHEVLQRFSLVDRDILDSLIVSEAGGNDVESVRAHVVGLFGMEDGSTA